MTDRQQYADSPMDDEEPPVSIPRVSGGRHLLAELRAFFVATFGGLALLFLRSYAAMVLFALVGAFLGFLLVVPTFGASVLVGFLGGGVLGYLVDRRRAREEWIVVE